MRVHLPALNHGLMDPATALYVIRINGPLLDRPHPIEAVQAAYQLDHRPTQEEVLAIAEKWRPYRSLATSYLFSAAFESAEVPPVA
jgi:hypothetical protein